MAISIKVKEINTGSADSSEAIVQTKRFDFNSPDVQKRFTKITVVYKASSIVRFRIYLDQDLEQVLVSSPTVTLDFPSQNSIQSASKTFSAVGKTGVLKITSTASNLEIDSIDIDYSLLGSNP